MSDLAATQTVISRGVMRHYNGVYWYVMDSIGGMLNHIGKMPKTQYKCNDLMVIMGIVLVLMETIMVSTGMRWILLVGC